MARWKKAPSPPHYQKIPVLISLDTILTFPQVQKLKLSMVWQKNRKQTVNKDLLFFLYGTDETTLKILTNQIRIEFLCLVYTFQLGLSKNTVQAII